MANAQLSYQPFVAMLQRYKRKWLAYRRIRLRPEAPHRSWLANKRWFSVVKSLLIVIAVICVATVAVITSFFSLTYLSINLTTISAPAQLAYIYYSDGTKLGEIVPSQGNRVEVLAEQIPDIVKKAVIVAEDADFYHRRGFSLVDLISSLGDELGNSRHGNRGLSAGHSDASDASNAGSSRGSSGHSDASNARAHSNASGSSGSGGSNGSRNAGIVEQYVENSYPDNSHSLMNRCRKLAYHLKLSHEWSKNKILTAYLNTVYFGRDSYGVAVGSQTFFHAPVDKLSISQAALLAAMIKNPTDYDPAVHYQQAYLRWSYVLDSLVKMGFLSDHERKMQVFPQVAPIQGGHHISGIDGEIKQQVVQELGELGFTSQQIATQGLRIITTISPKVQNAISDAVIRVMHDQPKNLQTAIVAIAPGSGAVRGYYGQIPDNRDGLGLTDNSVVPDYAQRGLRTGATFEVFALLAALEQGIPLSAVFDSTPYVIGDHKIKNETKAPCRQCNLAIALKLSLDTVYYRLMEQLNGGPAAIADAAHRAGVAQSFGTIAHTLVSENNVTQGKIVLGQYDTRVIDMASAYATIAASGMYHKTHFIDKVYDNQGHIMYEGATRESVQRFSSAVANNVIAAMKPIAEHYAHSLAKGRPSAFAVGTTYLPHSHAHQDAWALGFTPQLATAVWMGNNTGGAIVDRGGRPIAGYNKPADIWRSVMNNALRGEDIEDFPTPEKISGQAGIPPLTTTVITTPKVMFGHIVITLPSTTVTTVITDGRDVQRSHRPTDSHAENADEDPIGNADEDPIEDVGEDPIEDENSEHTSDNSRLGRPESTHNTRVDHRAYEGSHTQQSSLPSTIPSR